MTFERILKDFEMSYLAKTQVCPIEFAQVPRTSQLHTARVFPNHAELSPTTKPIDNLQILF